MKLKDIKQHDTYIKVTFECNGEVVDKNIIGNSFLDFWAAVSEAYKDFDCINKDNKQAA